MTEFLSQIGRRPLIDIRKYATQTGQLVSVTRDGFGDVDVTTITTISLLVYQERERQDQTNPTLTPAVRHMAVFASSIAVSEHDHLQSVVDREGATVLANARVKQIIQFGHWRYAQRFQAVELDVDLDG